MNNLYQRRNSKTSNSSADTNKVTQEQPKKLQNLYQMNEQLQKIKQNYNQASSRGDQQLIDNSSLKNIQYQESPQHINDSNQKLHPYSQQTVSPIPPSASNQPSYKSLPQSTAASQQTMISQDIKELQQKINEYAKSNSMLIERNAILENDLLLQRNQNNVLMHSNSLGNGLTSLNNTNNSLGLDRQLQAALIDKLRLEEIVEFMKEESEKIMEELNIYKLKSETLEKELKDTSFTIYQNQNQVQVFHTQNKRIEDQLKLSNIHFVNAQKKLSTLEKDNKELNEKLNISEQEKKKISQKWHAASQNRKQEEKLKQRLRELEQEFNEKSIECEEFKKKYVSTNTELRVYKEGEFNYKDIVENKFKELKDKWHEEIKQKEELLKQNNEILSQLEQFSNELSNLEQKNEKLTEENKNFNMVKQQLQEQTDRFQALTNDQEKMVEINKSVYLTRDELTKRLQIANQEITNLIKQNEESNQQILTLQHDKHIMNKQIEEFLKQNEQLQEALNSLLNENQQEQELLSHLTSKNNMNGSESKSKNVNYNINQNEEDDELQIKKQFEQNKEENSKKIQESSEYQRIIESLYLINNDDIINNIKQQIDQLIKFILQQIQKSKISYSLCNECKIQHNPSQTSQKGFEKQYYEIKNLYDRLLIKHHNLQKKLFSFEENSKNKQFGSNLSNSFQINKNIVNQISPQNGSFEDQQDQKSNGSAYKIGYQLNNQNNQINGINDSFESIKQITKSHINNQTFDQTQPYYLKNGNAGNQMLNYQTVKQKPENEMQQNNHSLSLEHNNLNNQNGSSLNKSYNFTSTLNSTNTNLIQNILKNDFKIKDTLSENSQKMLDTILNKFLNTQGLNQSLVNQQNKNSKSSGNLSEVPSATRLNKGNGQKLFGIAEQPGSTSGRSGPPTRTLERSIMRRNKSKENYQLDNTQDNHNISQNNYILNQSLDTYQRRYKDQHQNQISQQTQQKNNNNNNELNYNSNQPTGYTQYLKQRKNSNPQNQMNTSQAGAAAVGGYQQIHQMNRSFDGNNQYSNKNNNSSYSKFIQRKPQQQNNNINMSNDRNNYNNIQPNQQILQPLNQQFKYYK